MIERGQSPHERSAADENLKLMAKTANEVFVEFRRAGFTRREALELTLVYYDRALGLFNPERG